MAKMRRATKELGHDRVRKTASHLLRVVVNTDAMARTTQLVQQGFVKITE